MKISKKILASVVTLPLMLGSVTAMADAGQINHKQAVIHAVFAGVELSDAQKSQLEANWDKLATTPRTMDLQQRQSIEERVIALFEGVNLTEAQKGQMIANLQDMGKKLKERLQ